MTSMFMGAVGNESPFNHDISSWDIKSYNHGKYVRKKQTIQSRYFNWDVSKVSDFNYGLDTI